MKPSTLRLKLDLLKIHCMVANIGKVQALDDGWITLNGGSGEDEHGDSRVFIGQGGKIEKGAGSLVGKKLNDLKGTKKFTKYDTNSESAQPQSPENKQSEKESNNLTKQENTSTISSTSQSEAATGETKMNTNINSLVEKHGKEWTSPEGAKRTYFNGQDGIDFLTQLSESSEMPMPVPSSMGKKKLFQLKNGTFATDDGQIANVLRGAGLETIRSDKDFSKIKQIEKPTAEEKKQSSSKAVESQKAVEASKTQSEKLTDKINALHEKMQAHKKEHGIDDDFKAMSAEKSKLVKEMDAIEAEEAEKD